VPPLRSAAVVHGDASPKDKKNTTHSDQKGITAILSFELLGSGVHAAAEREFFIDNLLVRIHLIIEMILVDRPCTMGV